MVSSKRLLTLFLVGMLAGIVGDSCHAYTKVLGYHHPELFELLAWWVPPEFGVGGVLLGTIYGPIFRKLESIFNNNSRANEICATRTSFTNTKAFVGPLLFLGAYLLSSLLNAQGVNDQLISIALALIAFISWAYASSAKLSALLLSIMVAAAGVTWESLLCQHGIFFYYRPDRWYVRHWICWLWFAACAGNAPLFLKLEDEMEAKLEKKRR